MSDLDQQPLFTTCGLLPRPFNFPRSHPVHTKSSKRFRRILKHLHQTLEKAGFANSESEGAFSWMQIEMQTKEALGAIPCSTVTRASLKFALNMRRNITLGPKTDLFLDILNFLYEQRREPYLNTVTE